MCNAQPSTVLSPEEVRECSRKSNNANTFSKIHFKLARLKLDRDVGDMKSVNGKLMYYTFLFDSNHVKTENLRHSTYKT